MACHNKFASSMSPLTPPQFFAPPGRPTALHLRIREDLRERIYAGEYQAHDRVPSESALMGQYGVSRITVRQAMSGLEKEQLIFKIPGKGSFVTATKPFQTLTRLQGFAEAMATTGHETLNKVLHVRTLPATAQVATQLHIEPGAPVIEVQRVRYLNRQAVSLDITWLPKHIGERLAHEDLATRDIFLILENEYGLKLGHADLAIDATLADERLSDLLNISVGSALLRVERLTHDHAGKPLDYEHLYLRADNFQYRLRIERS